MNFSSVAIALSSSPIREMMGRAAAMDDVISFAVGQPDFLPAEQVIQAAKDSLDRGETTYAPGGGIPALRAAYAAYLSETDHVNYTPKDVMVTVGGMSAIYLAMTCLLNPGDEVLLPSPYWTNYAQQIILCGGVPVMVEVSEEDEFVISPAAIETAITPRTKLLLLNSPGNPTGGVIGREALLQIAQLAKKHDFFVMSDEVYRHIVFDGLEYTSIASIPGMRERTVIIDSCSKSFAMPGFRVGFAAGPKELIDLMVKVTEDVYSCTASCSQFAALEALRTGSAHRTMMVQEYQRRRDYIYQRFNSIKPLSCIKPKGAFYLFGNIGGTGLSAPEFCNRLLETQHVAMVPGNLFGNNADSYVRISYAVSMENIIRGMDRLEAFVRSLQEG